MNNFGDKIKKVRLEHGMSQEEFAKELGYTSKSTVNKIEKGVNDMSQDKLELLIKKFDLEVNDLFDKLAKDLGTKVISEDRTEIEPTQQDHACSLYYEFGGSCNILAINNLYQYLRQ
jgi:transcriptional regulator with XRE-family HTH domain